ncbi:MAG: formylglycine-generating enzyme family protein, partial [Gemmatimonadetes bacterium]|nr:formylglycine-generating enzyme family protein [Gemmatimonadota bacterium]
FHNKNQIIFIPPAAFPMGTTQRYPTRLAAAYGYHISWFIGEVPQRSVDVDAFYIDKFPVTNAQYAEFADATGHPPPAFWPDGTLPTEKRNHPVTGVNQDDAWAYAKWAGKRLPTEAEWEKAGRGMNGLSFPWGNQFDPEVCCWGRPSREGPAAVGSYPEGASPYGVMDMVGNVAEWCTDGPGPGSAFIKGGCYLTKSIVNLRPAARNMSGFTNNRSMFYGFRCAKEAG